MISLASAMLIAIGFSMMTLTPWSMQSNLGVDTALGGDADQLRLLLFDHFLIVGVAVNRAVVLQLMLCKQVFHLLGDDIADGCELQMVVEHRLDVVGCDSAAAD